MTESTTKVQFNIQRVTDIYEACGKNKLVIDNLVKNFFIKAPPMIQSLVNAARAGDALLTEELAHKLRGTFGNIGAEILMDVCMTIEDQVNQTGQIPLESVEEIDRIYLKMIPIMKTQLVLLFREDGV